MTLPRTFATALYSYLHEASSTEPSVWVLGVEGCDVVLRRGLERHERRFHSEKSARKLVELINGVVDGLCDVQSFDSDNAV